MILMRTKLNVLPEKQLEVLQTLRSLVGPMEGDSGCNSFGAFCDINDKNRFILLEEWEAQEDMDRHIRSRRFGVLLGTRTLLYEPPDIQIHRILHSGGMEMIKEVRRQKS